MFGTRIEAEVFEYSLTLYVKTKEDCRVIYLDLSEYLSAEFFVKEKEDKFVLTMKCENENLEKEIYAFGCQKCANRALKKVANAMLISEHRPLMQRLWRAFKFLLKTAVAMGVIIIIAMLLRSPVAVPTTIGLGDDMGASSPAAPSQSIQQERLPEGKPVPLDEVVK